MGRKNSHEIKENERKERRAIKVNGWLSLRRAVSWLNYESRCLVIELISEFHILCISSWIRIDKRQIVTRY